MEDEYSVFFPLLCSIVTAAAKAEPNRKGNSEILRGHVCRWKEDFLVTVISLVLPSPPTLPLAHYWFTGCETRASKDVFFVVFYYVTWSITAHPLQRIPTHSKKKVTGWTAPTESSRRSTWHLHPLGRGGSSTTRAYPQLVTTFSEEFTVQSSLDTDEAWVRADIRTEGRGLVFTGGFWTHRART